MASMSFSGARTLVTASVSRWGARGRNSRQPWMELSSFTVRRVWISSCCEASAGSRKRRTAMFRLSARRIAPRS